MSAQDVSKNTEVEDRGKMLEQRLAFFGIGRDAIEALQRNQSLVANQMEPVLDEFYAHLEKWPEMDAMFGSQEVKNHAYREQKRHWERIYSGRLDQDYLNSALSIGKTHNRIGLEPRWYIGGYAALTTAMIRRMTDEIMTNPLAARRNKAQLQEFLDALIRAIYLDMDLAISTFLEAKDADYAELMTRMTDDFDTNMAGFLKELAQASTGLSENAGKLSELAQGGSAQAEEMQASTQEASQNVDTVASAAEELSASIHEISTQINQSASIAKEASERTKAASQAIAELKESAEKIDDVIGLIDDIADQTNLLALNATIEAARAGEAGKGFAVVAGEVKELANQTGKATSEIAELIRKIQGSVQETANTMESVSGTIQKMEEISSSVASSVEEQSSATQEIVRSAQSAAEGSKGLDSVAQKVSETAQATNTESDAVKKASEEMIDKTEKLREQLDVFLSNLKTQ